MNQRERPNFRCWQCGRNFHQTLEIGDAAELLLECPFCGALAKVDLAPYRDKTQTLYRDGSTAEHPAAPDLPDPIPTAPRDQ